MQKVVHCLLCREPYVASLKQKTQFHLSRKDPSVCKTTLLSSHSHAFVEGSSSNIATRTRIKMQLGLIRQ